MIKYYIHKAIDLKLDGTKINVFIVKAESSFFSSRFLTFKDYKELEVKNRF